jgi:stearoyl-CoA desaturase (delta-9 desaturase)
MNELSVLPVANPPAELPPRDAAVPVSFGVQLANLIAVILPFAALLSIWVWLWGWGFSWVDLGVLVGMYVLTALGITVGFHRLFTHGSFKTYRPVQLVFGVLGSMAVQGPLLKWVALHRRHHQYSDEKEDPHSPHQHGSGIRGVLAGLWHAHIGWLFEPEPLDLERYVKDLRQSALLRVVSALFPLWIVAGLLIPAAVGLFVTETWMGGVLGLIWGGLVRIFLVHHVTWSVNSVCHLWGSQPYKSEDESRNNVLFGVLAMGEGWHNTHHAFPTSARHGLRCWQIDVSYYVIRCLALLGLAWNVKLPSAQAQLDARTS